MLTKLNLTGIVLLLLLFSSSSFATSVDFEKSISIEKYFKVIPLENQQHRELLQEKSRDITNLVSNVLRSFQQDYDYAFYNNYQLSKRRNATFQFLGYLLNNAQMNKDSEFFSFKDGTFFLKIEMYDPISHATIFGKTFEIDEYMLKNNQSGLMLALQDGLRVPLVMYFFNTSRPTPVHNNNLDSITLAIDHVFNSNENIDMGYLHRLTDLTSNAIVMHQQATKKQHIIGDKYRFRFFRNYLKQESGHKGAHSEFKGNLTYNDSKGKYVLDISLHIDGQRVAIPASLNPPIEFYEAEKQEYKAVALHIKQKIGLMLYYYFERYLPNQNN